MPKTQGLEKILSEKEASLKNWYDQYLATKKIYTAGLLMMVHVFFTNSYTFVFNYPKEGLEGKISKITLSAMLFDLVFTFYLSAYLFKLKGKTIENFYWRVERRRMIALRIGVLSIAMLTFILNFNIQTRFLAVLMLFFIGLFMFSIVNIYITPKKLFSSLLTNTGTIGGQMFVIIHFYYFISRWVNISGFWLVILLVIGCLIIWDSIKKREGKLNLVQAYAVKLIDNEKLIEAFKDEFQKINDKIEALKIMKKISVEEKYGVKLALANLLKEYNQNQSFRIITIIGKVISFFILLVLTSIAEGLIQDYANDDVKAFFCEYIGYLCP